jgi:hypothetical protein
VAPQSQVGGQCPIPGSREEEESQLPPQEAESLVSGRAESPTRCKSARLPLRATQKNSGKQICKSPGGKAAASTVNSEMGTSHTLLLPQLVRGEEASMEPGHTQLWRNRMGEEHQGGTFLPLGPSVNCCLT